MDALLLGATAGIAVFTIFLIVQLALRELFPKRCPRCALLDAQPAPPRRRFQTMPVIDDDPTPVRPTPITADAYRRTEVSIPAFLDEDESTGLHRLPPRRPR